MVGRPRAARPKPPTTGGEVLRKVDTHGSVSFAGTGYRVGNRYRGTRPSGFVSSAIPSRSPKTGTYCALTGPATTQTKNTGHYPAPEANHREPTMSHRYRSRNETRAPDFTISLCTS